MLAGSDFSAHTKDSARALMDTIKMTFPEAGLTLVVAMASDKDHLGFATECLSGTVRTRYSVLDFYDCIITYSIIFPGCNVSLLGRRAWERWEHVPS